MHFPHSCSVCPETMTTFESGFNFHDIVDKRIAFDFSSLDALEWVCPRELK